ncbi:MAG TPA: YceI family protein [Bacteroidota bacterium]
MKRFMFALLVSGMAISSVLAQGNWRTDKSHSNITFGIRHLVISEVVGNFGEWDVKVTSAKDDWSDATVEAVIKTASINTDNERRDNHLKSDDFFNAEQFPEVKFVSTGFEKTSENTYKIKGNITIRDITKPVSFDAEILGTLNDKQMGVRTGWKATTEINRFDFGLKWNRATEAGGLVAGEKVRITINLELIKEAA